MTTSWRFHLQRGTNYTSIRKLMPDLECIVSHVYLARQTLLLLVRWAEPADQEQLLCLLPAWLTLKFRNIADWRIG